MENTFVGWRWVDTRECYVCVCSKGVDTIEDIDTHISTDVRGGYCENGFRCFSETEYECICGKQFESRQLAFKHRIEIFNKCINEAKYKANSYCSKCELQLRTPHDLERHYDTNRHNNNDLIFKDLYCKSCEIQTHTQKQMKAHLASAKHKQVLEHGKIELECKVCDIRCRGQKQMLAHLETKKHKKLSSPP